MNEWISVKDRHPKYGLANRYLFVTGKKDVTFGYAYDPKNGWETGTGAIWIADLVSETNEVATHWMPLPEPPKQEE